MAINPDVKVSVPPGTRMLAKISERFGARAHSVDVQEVRVLEYSPSATWVKLQNDFGNKFWREAVNVQVIETLASLNAGKPQS